MAQWLSQWGRFSISYHVKDLWNFSSPQKSVVSNIAFRKQEYQISLVLTLLSEHNPKKVDTLWGKNLSKFCIHDFLSRYNWFVWPNLFPCWPFVLIKRQFVSIPAISPTYFQTNWWPQKKLEKGKEINLKVTHQFSQITYVSFCLPALTTFPESILWQFLYLFLPGPVHWLQKGIQQMHN